MRDAIAAIADNAEQVTQFFAGQDSGRGKARTRHESRLLLTKLAVRVESGEYGYDGTGRAPLILTPAGVAYTLFEPHNIVTTLGRAGWDSMEGVMNGRR